VSHRSARLTVIARRELVAEVAAGYSQAAVAQRFRVSRPTVAKWVRRFRAEGVRGLEDRHSTPHCSPRRTPARLERRIRRMRVGAGLGPGPIGQRLGLATSTVHAVLVRLRLNRLSQLHRVTRQVVRYERERAGELLHLDTKKLGKIPPGGGKRFFWAGFAETKSGPHGARGGGHDYVHVALDDHSRVTYVETLADEGGRTAAAFLERAIEAFSARGVTIAEILTDNAKAYVVSRHFQRVVRAHGLKHRRTQPYRPQTNGKAERFIQTLLNEWAYARPYTSNDARLRQLPRWVDYYNHRRPHGGIAGAVPASRL